MPNIYYMTRTADDFRCINAIRAIMLLTFFFHLIIQFITLITPR